MYKKINHFDEYEKFIKENKGVLVYISTKDCNVCKILKPRIEQSIKSRYPELRLVFIDINELPQITDIIQIVNVPTVIVYFESKEFIRKTRIFSISSLENEISRLYSVLFG